MFCEGSARSAVTNADVAKSPLDLSDWVGSPIHCDDFHLVSWQSLGDSVSPTSVVVGFEVPVALFVPESV